MKLNKAQAQKLSDAQDKASTAHAALSEAIAAYNAAVEVAFAALQEASEKYNNDRDEAQGMVTGIGEELREVWDGRTEKWQDSDAGQSAASFVESFENVELDEFSPDEPEAMEDPDDITDALNELPTESDE